MKILIVEDEDEMRSLLEQSLRKEQFVVELAAGYEEGFDKINAYTYDCILLDVMLPGGNGLKLLRHLKESGQGGNVIIISAKDSVDDKINGLNLGADDYLVKPFHLAELHARIHSVLRRKSLGGDQELAFANIRMNLPDRTVTINKEHVPLNRKEFDMLCYLMMNRNRLVNKSALAEHIWGDHTDQADDYEFIYSQIRNLRKKMKQHAASAEIQAVYGIGYKLVEA